MESFDIEIYDEVYEGDKPYVFISYAHADEEKRREIVDLLSAHGVRYWYDNGLHHSDDFNLEIAEHLEKATACLLLLSPISAESTYVKNELNFANTHHVPIRTLLLEEFTMPLDIELMISRSHYLRMDKSSYMQQLILDLPAEVFEGNTPTRLNFKDKKKLRSKKRKQKKVSTKKKSAGSFFKKLLIVIAVLLVVFAALTIMEESGIFGGSDPSPVITLSRDATIPDFADFATGYATKNSDETDNEKGTREIKYVFDSGNADAILKEYIELLKDNYNFSPIYDGVRQNWYVFEYRGKNRPDGFELYFGDGENQQAYSGINLSLFLSEKDGKKWVQLYVNSEIKIESTDKRTTFAKRVCVPDFSEFAKGYATYVETIPHEDLGTQEIIYEFDYNTNNAVLDEYIALLENSYNYSPIHTGVRDGWFAFEYTGSGEVTAFELHFPNNEDLKYNGIHYSLCTYAENGKRMLQIYMSDEIEIINNGERY